MSIFAHPPIVVHNGQSVCVCFRNGNRTVSLHCDDSCGRMPTLGRCDIELLRDSSDPKHPLVVTDEVFADLAQENDSSCEFLVVPGTLENFERAMRWLRRTSWGFVTSSQEPRA